MTLNVYWHSNSPFAATGYGVQTKVFTKRLQTAGHRVGIGAFWGQQAGVIGYDGMTMYPNGFHGYGCDIWGRHAHEFFNGDTTRPGIVLSLIDAWVLTPETLMPGQRWVPWFPIDMEPLAPPIQRAVSQAWDRIVFSRYGESVVNGAGLSCQYVPHGYDSSVFYPDPDAAEKVRAQLGLGDRFVVTSVMANKGTPSRKAWPQHLEAFAQLHKRHPDTVYVCHTLRADNGENQGVNLPELAAYLGIQDAVVFPDQYSVFMGAPEAFMRGLYSASDVLANVAMGEGFGVPILEAQACGCPVIVGDWTAMSELCFAGWTVEKQEAIKCWTPLAAYQYLPDPGAIADRLLHAYDVARSTPELHTDAVEGAKAYDADTVTRDFWVPVLAGMEERIAAEAEAPKVTVETAA